MIYIMKRWTLMSIMLFVATVALAAGKVDNDQRLWYDAPATVWLSP